MFTEERLPDWHPSKDELEAILAEMRPIVRGFADRARTDLPVSSLA